MVLNDLEVLDQLRMLDYPASKQDLVVEAEARGGSQHFIESLQAVPIERFAGHGEVIAALEAGSGR